MKHLIWVLLLCPLAYGAGCPKAQVKKESALVQAEQTWARALEQRDAATLGCLLAEEFEDADPSGKLTDRAITLAGVATRRAGHNELSELTEDVNRVVEYIRGLTTEKYVQGKVVARECLSALYGYLMWRWP